MGITESIIKNIVDTNFENLDKETVERAKWRVLDSIGVIVAGANAPGCDAMLNLINKWGGAEESTVLVHHKKAPAHLVALANSLMMRSYDFEAIEAEGENQTSSPAHISGSTVPAALAAAEKKGASGKEFITALVLGDDLAARLAGASGMDFTAGWDNTGTINSMGTTAIAAKLMDLDETQILNAFGIVLNQIAGSIAAVWDKTLCFKLPIALAAQRGIFSAELAREGFPGVKDPFMGNHGYFSIYAKNGKTEGMLKELGKKFYADCVIKPWPCCRATHPALDAALRVATENNIDTKEIQRITINMNPGKDFVLGQFIPEEATQVKAAFSIPYTVACALLRKSVKPEHFSTENLRDPEISRLIGLMEFNQNIPKEKYQNAEAIVTMKDGKVYSAYTNTPKGDIFKNPMTTDEILEKFNSNVAFSQTISQTTAEKIRQMVDKLEDLKDIRELTELL